MKRSGRDYFAELHPAVQFSYFAAVTLFSMFTLHPVFLLISLVCGLACSAEMNRGKTAVFALKFLLPLVLVMTVVNPLLNHSGRTVFLYVNDSPLTLEAVAYGAAAALMFASVLLWFSCGNAVLTADKLIGLFGKAAPSLTLLLTMTLRFVPRFRAQVRVIADAQKGIGRGADRGSVPERAKTGLKILSMLTTWALENGIVTADSMRARGYGLPGRSCFRPRGLEFRDKSLLIILYVLISTVCVGLFTGKGEFRYFPSVSRFSFGPVGVLVLSAYFLLCAFPLWVNAVLEGKYRGNF